MAVPRWGVLAAAFALVSVSAFGFTVAPSAVDARPTRLDTCTTITESGTYVLTRDVESRAETCLRITADHVTLSGGEHSIDGGAFRENTTAVAVTGSNVTVRNLSVLRWTFGVRYEDAPDGAVRNVTTWRTVDGVTFASSPGATVAGVSAENGVTGIAVVESNGAVVRDSVVRYQSSTGVLVADSRNVGVSNVTVARAETGLALLGSPRARVSDTVVRASETPVADENGTERRAKNGVANATTHSAPD